MQEIARLNFLMSLGLAKKVAAKRWVLSEKLELTLRELQLSSDIIKSKARHGLGVTPLQELMKPTVIGISETLVGRVIGMGLDHELFDKRYLLLDGSDGKIHYIRATESLVKARDAGRFKDGDVIALTGKTFNPLKAGERETGQTIQYLHVTNCHSLAALQQATDSRLDHEVIAFIRQQGGMLPLPSEATDFAKQYRQALLTRFEALKAAGLFENQGGKVVLKDNVDSLLDDIVHRRIAPSFEKWTPVFDRKMPDKPLAGKIVASNERVLLVHDSRDQYYQVNCADLGLKYPKKVDSYLYIRSNRPLGLAFSRTDARLVSSITKQDCYDPKQHKACLMQQLRQQTENFFLKDEKAIDAFVLAHQRRADTWVKWHVLTVKAGCYWPVSDRDQHNEPRHSLENQMHNLIERLKEKCLKQPAMATTLSEEMLRGGINQFNVSDKLLSEIGLPASNVNDWLSQALRQQHACWTQRGVTLTQDFEKVARNWLAENPVEITLTSIKQHYQRPLQVVQANAIKANTALKGKLVTLEAKDHQDKRYVVLLQEKQLLALPAEEIVFRTCDRKVGQTLSVNQVFSFKENRFVCQWELRLDKAHEKTRQSLTSENVLSQSRE